MSKIKLVKSVDKEISFNSIKSISKIYIKGNSWDTFLVCLWHV